MNTNQINLLLIEDSERDAQLIIHEFSKDGAEPNFERVESLEAIRTKLKNKHFDAVLADYSLPHCDGPQIIRAVREVDKIIPVVVVSGTVGEDIAVQMLKLGANDYILKHDLKRLAPAIDREIRAARETRDRIAAQKTLEEREGQLTAIIARAMDAIVSFNAEQKIILFNAAAERMFGYSAKDIIGEGVEKIFTKESYEILRARLQTCLSKEDCEGALSALQGYCANNETFPIEVALTRSVGGESVIGTMIIRDLRERQKLEQQLKDSQKLEVVGEMAVGIAHDLNNILTAVIGYSQLALCGVKENQQLQDNLAAVHQSAMRARGIIRKILTFGSRAQATPEVLSVRSVIEEVLTIINATIPPSLEVKVQMKQRHVNIFADSNQVHQVILNLCTNAIAALEGKKGVITIASDVVELQKESDVEPGTYASISVSDNGVGMSSDLQERIFEPFFTTKQKGRGSGLGLSVVRSIIRDLKGKVTVQSNKGKGSIFSVFLPYYTSSTQEQEPLTPSPHVEGTERVLVIDDEPIIADLVKQMLEILGYSVTAFTDANQAIDHFKQYPNDFDLIFTDQTMPLMPGMQVVKEVRQMRPGIPALISTGFGVIKEEFTSHPLDHWIGKPFTMGEMGGVIRRIFDSEKKNKN